jgi:uncharacterized iron-regulated membrane protein
MRKWHRWLSLLFAVFLLWISVTGVLSQLVPIVQGSNGRGAQASSATPGFVCPADMICRPKPKPGEGRGLVGTLHHLHSGESFGPLGVLVATLAGFAMIFFSFSGLWLYVAMWRNRSSRNLKPGWFWK